MKKGLLTFVLFLLCLSVWLPMIMMISSSFMSLGELNDRFSSALSNGAKPVKGTLLPSYPTLRPFFELLLDSPGFFTMFWNSCKQAFPILIGQLFVALPAAWAFARFRFRGKNALFLFYIILMILPFQVTMVSSYLVLDRLKLMDTHFAIILPGIFSTFPVFIMVKFFKTIPLSLIEAAQIDGAGEWSIFFKIGIPMGLPGIVSAMLLGFLEYWNAIEQPLTFLKNKELWPLSLYLPNITTDKISVSFAASVIMMMPSVLLFIMGQSYLEQGIVASGIKE